MLLLIDFLMLRCRECQSLLQLNQDWEVKFAVMCTSSLKMTFQSDTVMSVCFSGTQKSVPAAKLFVLHCTLPFPSQSAGRYGSKGKWKATTQSWSDATECPNHVPWRFGNECLEMIMHYPSVTLLLCIVGLNFTCVSVHVFCSADPFTGSVHCATRCHSHITWLLWPEESDRVVYASCFMHNAAFIAMKCNCVVVVCHAVVNHSSSSSCLAFSVRLIKYFSYSPSPGSPQPWLN